VALQHQEYSSYFLDYKALKRLLKPITHRNDRNEALDNLDSHDSFDFPVFARSQSEISDAEERFVLALESEIAKVESFFRTKVAEMTPTFRKLCRRVTRVEERDRSLQECTNLMQLKQQLAGLPEACLIEELLKFSSDVDLLRAFVMTNAQAIVKICKKHDKNSTVAIRDHYIGVLHRCTFYSSREFGVLIADIEVLALQLIERLTGNKPSPDVFQCPVCMHVLNNPLVLSCGHRFCNSCVSAAAYFGQHSCPVCRKECVLNDDNIKIETLLGRFLQNHFELSPRKSGSFDLEQLGESQASATRSGTCVLQSPCEFCRKKRDERLPSRLSQIAEENEARGMSSTSGQDHASSHPRPLSGSRFRACSEIFSSQTILSDSRATRYITALLLYVVSLAADLATGMVALLGEHLDPRLQDVLAQLCSVGQRNETARRLRSLVKYLCIASLVLVLVLGAAAWYGDVGSWWTVEQTNETCASSEASRGKERQGESSVNLRHVLELQEKRTKSLHRALDKMLMHSTKK